METRIIETAEDFQALEQPWERLHREVGGTVFQTFQWNAEWWKVYAQPNFRLRVVCIIHDGMLVGIIPMFVETLNMLLFRLRRMRFLGVYETYGEYTPLIHPAYRAGVTAAAATFCAGEIINNRSDMISFFRFPPASDFMKQLRDALGSSGVSVHFTPHCVTRLTMDLPQDWETYLGSLSSTERRMLRRRTRTLAHHGAEVEILQYPENGKTEFNDFVRLHTATWVDKGIPGYFASSRFETFQREIMSQLNDKNMARLYFLKQNGVRFAAVQAFFTHDQCCFYLSGLDRQHALAHYSPGKVLLGMVIKDAIEEGYKVFDFQGGKESYKFRLGGKQTSFSKMELWKPGMSSMKVLIFRALQTVRRFFLDVLWENIALRPTRRIRHRTGLRNNNIPGKLLFLELFHATVQSVIQNN